MVLWNNNDNNNNNNNCAIEFIYIVFQHVCTGQFVMLADDSLASSAESGPEPTPLATPPVYQSDLHISNMGTPCLRQRQPHASSLSLHTHTHTHRGDHVPQPGRSSAP
jgi:hypothetical protein